MSLVEETTTHTISSIVSKIWSGKESLFPWVPKPVKVLILLVFLLNSKSWPFVWHFKVWYPAIVAHYKARRMGLEAYYKLLGIGVRSMGAVNGSAQASTTAVGTTGESYKFKHPCEVKSIGKYRAGFDDCDYNYHLSNSAYAKNLDSARMKACIDLFSPMFACGGWMALGASHYHFIKEIPIFADYEIQMSVGGFEDKWMYLVGEFVTYPKKQHKRENKIKSRTETVVEPTDLLAGQNGTDPLPSTTTIQDRIEKQVLQRNKVRSDGGVLNCFSVSVYCFKVGRITVPPRVALSFSGYGNPSNWDRAQNLILHHKDRGKKWLQGGWKDESEPVGGEWQDGEFADRMKAGDRVREGLDSLRKLVGEGVHL